MLCVLLIHSYHHINIIKIYNDTSADLEKRELEIQLSNKSLHKSSMVKFPVPGKHTKMGITRYILETRSPPIKTNSPNKQALLSKMKWTDILLLEKTIKL